MNISIEHNLTETELNKALAGMAIGSGIENELIETLSKAVCACDDKTPRLPKHRAMRALYRLMVAELHEASRDIENSVAPMQKAVGKATALTADQIRQLTRLIQDRFGFIAAQVQSVDYQPPEDMLERWKQLGLVDPSITPETFAASVPAEMHFIKNAYLMGKLIETVESGESYQEVMKLALNAPILAPDLHAIAIAEEQTALYIRDNAADLATAVGRLAIQKRNETIRQMAVDYHSRTLKRTVLDEDLKREAGEEIPERYVENWQQFKSELHHTLNEKDRDLERVAFYELQDATKQGQAHRLLQDGNVDKLVYKQPLDTACAQCKFLYLQKDGVTPRVFKLSDMINNGSNIGRKPWPVKGSKVNPAGRTDGAETLKAVVGLLHPWCQCLGVYELTGHEPWLPLVKKSQMNLFDYIPEKHERKDAERHLASGAVVHVHNTTATVHTHHSEPAPLPVGSNKPQEATVSIPSKIHKFEAAGMGKAPFKLVGMYSIPSPSMAEQNPEAYNNAMREMPQGVGIGSCRYCGMPLTHNFIIRSADGKKCTVGSDCVEKTNDDGLTSSIKSEKRKVVADKRNAEYRSAKEIKDQAERERNGGKTDDEIRQEKVAAEMERRNAISAQITTMLAPLATSLASYSNHESDFAGSLSKEMAQGTAPSGRAMNIIVDMLSKQAGRSNSKAYNAEYDRLWEIMDAASELEKTKWNANKGDNQ